jgi:Tfp pilus assembly protein PilX
MNVLNTIYDTRYTRYEKGAALLFTLMVMIVLTSVVGAYLGFVQSSTKSTGAQISDSQAIYLAEAGLQKAVWNLMRTAANGGQGENWTTTGTTENLGAGSYTMVVERWDWALAANDATASASSETGGNLAGNAVDGSNTTYWQSANKPVPGNPEEIIINFPYKLTINKVRFLVPNDFSRSRPRNYTWQISSDGVSYGNP